MAHIESELINAVTFNAYFKDFSGDAKEWQAAYFKLLAWKNTWSIPLVMDILSTGTGYHEAYLHMVIEKKGKLVNMARELLKDYGYRKVYEFDTTIRVLMPDYEEDVDDYIVDC